MYIDTYAKDYVDTMMISPGKTEAKKDEGKQSGGDIKENNELAKETSDASGKDQVWIHYLGFVQLNFGTE